MLWWHILQWGLGCCLCHRLGSSPPWQTTLHPCLNPFHEHHSHFSLIGSWTKLCVTPPEGCPVDDGFQGGCSCCSHTRHWECCGQCTLLATFSNCIITSSSFEHYLFSASMRWVGGHTGMNLWLGVQACQPKRAAWTLDCLWSQQAIYLSNCLDASTKITYQSGMNSYITFCNLHHLDLEPLPDTLSFFISYMAHQTGPSGKTISIWTISSYLSGIAHHLEPFYPSIRSIRKHPLVIKMIQGAEKTDGHSILWKLLIEDNHLCLLVSKLGSSDDFNDCLFLTICFTAYHGLMRLREIVTPDNPKKLNFHKLSLHHMVEFIHNNSIHAFKFNLPTHKVDWQYHGNSVVIQSRCQDLCQALVNSGRESEWWADGMRNIICMIRCKVNLCVGPPVTVAYRVSGSMLEVSQNFSWRQMEMMCQASRIFRVSTMESQSLWCCRWDNDTL